MKREAAREEKKETKKETQDKKETKESHSFQGRRSVISLFRTLARKLHPDSPAFIQTLSPERVRTLWLEAQQAYQSRNLEGLLAIMAWVEKEEGGGGLSEVFTFAERVDRIRALKRSVSRLEKKRNQSQIHPAWGFQKTRGAERKKLRSRATRELEIELERVQDAFSALEDFIESIGRPRAPRLSQGSGRKR